MKKSLIVAILVAVIIVSSETVLTHGLALETSNGSKCTQPSPMQITYYSGTSASDSYQVPLAAESWNDMPAMIHLSSIASSGSAAITVASTLDPSRLFLGITFTAGNPDLLLTCSNGNVNDPTQIIISDYYVSQEEANSTKIFGFQLSDNDFRVHILAHELGHAIGLAHSQVLCSLMYESLDNIKYCGQGVYFPVVDDIKGAAMLYGWAFDASFASQSVSGNGKVSWEGNGFCVTCPPVDLQVLSPSTSSVKVYNNSALPSTNIAIMMAYVTPQALYRFNIGWQTNFSPFIFSTLELDNDGAKLVYEEGTCCAVINLNSSFSPQASSSYFLELVVEQQSGSAAPTTHAYVYQGNIASTNGAEYFDGHSSHLMAFSTPIVTSFATWADAASFDGSVWTDSSSNPPSGYNLDHFWNFQGSASKYPMDNVYRPAVDSITPSTNPTMGIDTTLTFNAHAYVLSSVQVAWGDGTQTMMPFDYTVFSGVQTIHHTYYAAPGVPLPAYLIVTDTLGLQYTSRWSVSVAGFSLSPSPTSLNMTVGALASSVITIGSIFGFSGTVSLDATTSSTVTSGPTAWLCRSGPQCAFNTAITVTVPAGGSTQATLYVSTSLATPVGTYKIYVNGLVNGAIVSTAIALNVSSGGGGGGGGSGGHIHTTSPAM